MPSAISGSRVLATVVAAVAVFGSACVSGGENKPLNELSPSAGRSKAAPLSPAPPAAALGVAGLVPPHFPNASEADWKTLSASLVETGPLLGVYTNWADSEATKGQPPAVFDTALSLARQQKLTVVAALGASSDAGGTVRSTINWNDSAERGRFVAAAAALAKKYQPAYLALGGEVNRLWEADPAAFDGFVSGYVDTYTAIKAASPETRVFTVFQLEYMKGAGHLSGQARSPEWDLIARFGDRLDLVAFTTYPFLDYETPDAVPAGYYAEAVLKAAGKPVAFTEVGWPSAPLAAAPSSGFGGTPEEQAAFVRRFFELTKDVHPVFALWAFPFDVGAGAGTFASVALRDTDGTARPALAAWKEHIGR